MTCHRINVDYCTAVVCENTWEHELWLNTRNLWPGSLGDDTHIRAPRSSHRSQVKDEQTGEADRWEKVRGTCADAGLNRF